MWSEMVVIHPPRFDLAPGIFNRQELIGVETSIAQLAVEGLDKALFRQALGVSFSFLMALLTPVA